MSKVYYELGYRFGKSIATDSYHEILRLVAEDEIPVLGGLKLRHYRAAASPESVCHKKDYGEGFFDGWWDMAKGFWSK